MDDGAVYNIGSALDSAEAELAKTNDRLALAQNERDTWRLRAESAADELKYLRERLATVANRLHGNDPVMGARRRAV